MEVELVKPVVELIVSELDWGWIEVASELDDTADSVDVEISAVKLDIVEIDSPVLDGFVELTAIFDAELDTLSSTLELALGMVLLVMLEFEIVEL